MSIIGPTPDNERDPVMEELPQEPESERLARLDPPLEIVTSVVNVTGSAEDIHRARVEGLLKLGKLAREAATAAEKGRLAERLLAEAILGVQEGIEIEQDLAGQVVKGQKRIVGLQHDKLTGAWQRDGLEDLLDNSLEGAQYREAIRQGDVGVLFLDARGIKIMNDLYSHSVGDRFIRESAIVLHDLARAHSRSGDRRTRYGEEPPTAEERRQGDRRREGSPEYDLVVRWGGGDEFVVVYIGIAPERLRLIADEIGKELSPEVAARRGMQGEVPVVASVTHAHLSQLEGDLDRLAAYMDPSERPRLADIRAQIDSQNVTASEEYRALMAAVAVADIAQEVMKDDQYAAMFTYAAQRATELGLPIPPEPSESGDKRLYGMPFFEIFGSLWVQRGERGAQA